MALISANVTRTGPVRNRKLSILTLGLAGALFLAGCNQNEDVILPGERLGLRDVLTNAEPAPEQENQTREIVLAAQSNNADWAQFWGNPAARADHAALSAVPGQIWTRNIGVGNSRKQRITADPVIGGGAIYTLDSQATLTATSTEGSQLWQKNLASGIEGADDISGGGITYADGRIYVGLGLGRLFVMDATSGTELWSQNLQGTASGAPTVFGDLVYLTSGDDTGWALETETGRIRWQIGSTTSVANVHGAPAPVVADDLAIFAFGSGDVQAVFRRGGLRRWDAAVVGQRRGFALSQISDVTGAPVVHADKVFVGNQSVRVVALALGSVKRLWTALDGAISPIWPAGDSVFFVSDRNELIRLDAEDGTRIWGARLPNFVKDRPKRKVEVFAHFGPILAGGRIWVASSDGNLRGFDPTDGNQVATVAVPSGAASAPAIAQGTLYVVNTRGELLAYR